MSTLTIGQQVTLLKIDDCMALTHRYELKISRPLDAAPATYPGKGQRLAVVHQRLIGGEQQDIRGAAHFVLRVLEAQSRFEGDEPRQIIAPRCNEGAGLGEDPVAIVAGERRLEGTPNLERAPDIAMRSH